MLLWQTGNHLHQHKEYCPIFHRDIKTLNSCFTSIELTLHTASAINCNALTFMHTPSRTRVLVMQLGSIRHAISFLSLFKWWCSMTWHTVLVYRMRSRDNNHCCTLFSKNIVKLKERCMLTGLTELHQIPKHSDSMRGWWDKHENSFRSATEMASMLCIVIYLYKFY
jgi:hypothetical protein